jgi:hypothetical protein
MSGIAAEAFCLRLHRVPSHIPGRVRPPRRGGRDFFGRCWALFALAFTLAASAAALLLFALAATAAALLLFALAASAAALLLFALAASAAALILIGHASFLFNPKSRGTEKNAFFQTLDAKILISLG